MSQTTISLVRHGEVYNPTNVFYGRLPRFGLSDLGRTQAHTAGQYLAQHPITTIFTSPMLRARQTAAIVESCLPHDVPVRATKKLIEIDSPFDGIDLTHLHARNWDLYSDISDQYEQPQDVLQRTRRWVAQVRRHYAGQHVIGVTHGDVVMYKILWALNAPMTLEAKISVAQERFQSDYLHTASISTFTYATADPDERPHFTYLAP